MTKILYSRILLEKVILRATQTFSHGCIHLHVAKLNFVNYRHSQQGYMTDLIIMQLFTNLKLQSKLILNGRVRLLC